MMGWGLWPDIQAQPFADPRPSGLLNIALPVPRKTLVFLLLLLILLNQVKSRFMPKGIAH
jgi:hypothetical protein